MVYVGENFQKGLEAMVGCRPEFRVVKAVYSTWSGSKKSGYVIEVNGKRERLIIAPSVTGTKTKQTTLYVNSSEAHQRPAADLLRDTHGSKNYEISRKRLTKVIEDFLERNEEAF